MSHGSFELISTEAVLLEERWAMDQRLKVYLDHLVSLQKAHLHNQSPEALDSDQTITDAFLNQLRIIKNIIHEDLRQTSRFPLLSPTFVHSTNSPNIPSHGFHSCSSSPSNDSSGEMPFRRIQLLYRLISRQLGFLLIRPKMLRTRGTYRPPLSACQLSFRYGAEYFVFKEEDFSTNCSKLIQLNLDLLPHSIAVRVQQGLFRASVYPMKIFRFLPATDETVGGHKRKNQNPALKSVLELSFPVEYTDCTGEVVAWLEIEWLFVRRPFCLGHFATYQERRNELLAIDISMLFEHLNYTTE